MLYPSESPTFDEWVSAIERVRPSSRISRELNLDTPLTSSSNSNEQDLIRHKVDTHSMDDATVLYY